MHQALNGSSRFLVVLGSDRMDGDELDQREEIVLIPVFIGKPLCRLYSAVAA